MAVLLIRIILIIIKIIIIMNCGCVNVIEDISKAPSPLVRNSSDPTRVLLGSLWLEKKIGLHK